MALKKAGKYRLPKNYKFPTKTQVLTKFNRLAGASVNAEDDFSSKALTDWYVEEFCKSNNLKL